MGDVAGVRTGFLDTAQAPLLPQPLRWAVGTQLGSPHLQRLQDVVVRELSGQALGPTDTEDSLNDLIP